MSSIPTSTIEAKRRLAMEAVWGGEIAEYELTAEIEGEAILDLVSPIVVDGDKLEISSNLLDIGRVHLFEYLGSQMVLWKLPSGAIDLFEIV